MSTTPATAELVVERVGPQALVVDRGRPGWAHIGVPGAGALDPPALDLANRLVGNPPDAAGLEVLLGGLALRAGTAVTVAVTGPPAAVTVEHRGRPTRGVGGHLAVHLRGGDLLVLAAPSQGLRLYLAVAGGFDADPVLGSRSADTLSGLGPPPLAVGDRLALGPPVGPPPPAGPVGVSVPPDPLVLPVRLGPREDWIADAATALTTTAWAVGPDADRVGVRLAPAGGAGGLTRTGEARDRELPSEGLVLGAVQVPPDGRPVVFLADHPVTGGYPVVAVVDRAALPALAQARPGTAVRFVPAGGR